jgi:hypothetical protein
LIQLSNELKNIIDASFISSNLETLNSYASDYSFVNSSKPALVISPGTADEVHEIVKWANKTHTPVIPVSSGSPHFNGDTVPGEGGAVIVDLRRMNRIIRIDRRTRMIVIEPGVTYSQLQPELAKHNLRLSTPLLPRANKSVIASLLERQPTLVPKYQWTLPEPMRCLEIVWGNGARFMTGEAGELAVFKTLEKQWEKGISQMTATGPGQVDYHRIVSAAQGTMGIATWASIKCEILPTIHKLFFIPAGKLEDLIDCTYKILRFRLGDELLILNNMQLATMLASTSNEIKSLREKLPLWTLIIGIAGREMLPEERIEFQEADIKEITQKHNLSLLSDIPGVKGDRLLDIILNPSKEPYWKLRYLGGCQDIFFLTTLNRTSNFIDKMREAVKTFDYSEKDMGIYIQPLQQGASCHCEFSLPYVQSDPEQVDFMHKLTMSASEEMIKEGGFFSRPYPIWAEMTYNREAQTTQILKKLKKVFDPNNVLNPGKLCF